MAYRFAEHPSTANETLVQRAWPHIEIADPVTWISAITAVICGALAAGRGESGFQLSDMSDLLRVGLAAVLCGPLCTGFSQSINDYCDRELDAINDPGRPIPSGRLSLRAARLNWMLLGLGTLALAFSLGRYSPWIPPLGMLGLALAAAYSVPPLKLKQRFWLGAPAVGLGYITMSWMIGHLIFAPMTRPSLVVALINGVLGIGLLWLNDIKSIEGDRQLGLQSMTVALGARRTLIISFLVIGAAEVALLGLALLMGYRWGAAVGVLALLVPVYWQVRLYQEPTHVNFQHYMLVSNPFVLVIQVTSALVVGGYLG
ncbi:MAG: UbiA family prenyltransferase [Chloroflexales bacterium]|nr:UbiA family prenyltransferase [Chloroflexales bacterium]